MENHSDHLDKSMLAGIKELFTLYEKKNIKKKSGGKKQLWDQTEAASKNFRSMWKNLKGMIRK